MQVWGISNKKKWSHYRSDRVNYWLDNIFTIISIRELLFGIQGQVTPKAIVCRPKFELIWELMAVLATCKFDEDPIKIEGTIDLTRSNMGFIGSQGQITPKWKVWSGWNSNSSKNLWLSWLTASLLSLHSRASKSDVNRSMGLEVDHPRFMVVLVNCKIEKDWIKSEVAIVWTTLSPL